MNTKRPLGEDQFYNRVRYSPLVAMDIVIADAAKNILVGLRANEPAKGVYFVPGGVIWKDESFEKAFRRILLTEVGQDVPITAAHFLGAYEHFYTANRFDDPSFGTHYIVLGYRVQFNYRPEIRLDDQHSSFRWMSISELLTAADVHEYTKDYFR